MRLEKRFTYYNNDAEFGSLLSYELRPLRTF